MRRQAFSRGAIPFLAVCGALASGCAPLLIAGGVVGGYAISKDSISNTFDLSPSHVFEASRQVAEKDGLVTMADDKRGLLKAQVPGANVTITVKRLTSRTVELKVQARNDALLPKIDTAQTIYNQIVERL